MDYMDLTVHCLRKAVKLNQSLTPFLLIFMHPPLGKGDIMVFGCPSVLSSVHLSQRPTITQMIDKPSVRLSACLSVCLSGTVLVTRFHHRLPWYFTRSMKTPTAFGFRIFMVIYQITRSHRTKNFRVSGIFLAMQGMPWNLTCWWILTNLRIDY